MDNNNTKNIDSQELKIIQKCAIKKGENKKVIEFLEGIHEEERAARINDCATFIGITKENGITKIVKSNFCRERLCGVCAWRRQSKFVAQMLPVIEILKKQNYRFIEVVLTVKNEPYERLKKTIDNMLKAYKKILDTRKIKRVWKGCTRSLEITYNHNRNDFHPHIHMLIVVEDDYFVNSEKYIEFSELQNLWAEKMDLDYNPNIYISTIENEERGAVENLKYSLKPSNYNEALKMFHLLLKGKRLVSFSGLFAKIRKELKYTDFNDFSDESKADVKTNYNLYKFDVSGGIYNFYKNYDL